MKTLTTLTLAGVLLAGPAHALAEEAETEAVLKVGDTAPDFTLPGSDGKTYALKDLVGEQAVVIAWFPKAFTGG